LSILILPLQKGFHGQGNQQFPVKGSFYFRVALARTPENSGDFQFFAASPRLEPFGGGGQVIPAIIISDWEEENSKVSMLLNFLLLLQT